MATSPIDKVRVIHNTDQEVPDGPNHAGFWIDSNGDVKMQFQGTVTTLGTGGTGDVAITTSPLSQFAATTSAQLRGVISDETGTGVLVFATSPTLTTPVIGAATFTGLTAGATGATMKTDTTTAHTLLFQAYDVDGTAYKTFATLTNGNTPDFTLAAPSGGTLVLKPSTYKSSDGTAGAAGGTFTTITSITVKDGIVTDIQGS